MTFFLLLCMLYEMSGGRRTGVDLSAPHVQMKYAPVMELVDMRDLGSRAAMRVGSSPFRRTNQYNPNMFPIGDEFGLFIFIY